MNQRSRSLQARLSDIEQRLRAMRTVTNTASAEITGGETIIDVDGSLLFADGGRLVLGSSSIGTSGDRKIIDEEGNLDADSLTVHGDVLSARDYLYQREGIDIVVMDETVPETTVREVELGFPDWASSAMVTTSIHVNTRVKGRNTNALLITLNGKPVARPRSDEQGNISLRSSVVRRVFPETPTVRLGVTLTEETVPVADPRIMVTMGGVYSA